METTTFEPLSEYLTIARKVISKFAPGYARRMLYNEDAVSSVAHAIMVADWKWNPDYRSKNNKVRSKYSFRNQHAIWAIQTYISSQYKKTKTTSLFSNTDEEGTPVLFFLTDKKKGPVSDVLKQEENSYIQDLIEDMLASSVISRKQAKYIRSYYLENKTLEVVGQECGVSKEAVRQGIVAAISKLQEVFKYEY